MLPAPDPWADRGRLDAAALYAGELQERVLRALADGMGRLHGETHTERYWRLLLMPWLMVWVPALFERWTRVHAALAAFGEFDSVALAESQTIVPSDSLEASLLLKGDAYNLQVFGRILGYLGCAVREFDEPLFGDRRLEAGADVRKPAIDRLAASMGRLHGGRVVLVKNAQFPYTALLRLAVASGGKVLPAASSPRVRPCAPDPSLRRGLGALALGEELFERFLAEELPRAFPTCFVEGYAELRRAAAAFGSFPSAVLTTNSWYYDEAFKVWSAAAAEGGTQLLGSQHGGNYGIDAKMPSEDHETTVTDGYYTWGWTREGRHALSVPMPAPKLMGRPRLGADPSARGILFVGTAQSRYLLQFPYTFERFDAYLAWQVRFAAALAPAAAAELHVRSHHEDEGWGIRARWRHVLPGVTLESGEIPFAESLRCCRLFVCDHLSTTFAEALSADKPSVLFWDPAAHPERPEARDVMDGLRRAGILFDSPEDAAAAADQANADVVGWWTESERAAAVEAFRRHFARTDFHSVRKWETELRHVLGRTG
jgi:putative transferase (TIGR04331 family)